MKTRSLARLAAIVTTLAPSAPVMAGSGACCREDGVCISSTEVLCDLFGGVYQGDGTDCASIDCIGACCLSNGDCLEISESACNARMGGYAGNGTVCFPGVCRPPTGACCFDDGTCQILDPIICFYEGGVHRGHDVDCEASPCVGACCLPDGSCGDGSFDDCVAAGGSFRGFATSCAATFCGINACVMIDNPNCYSDDCPNPLEPVAIECSDLTVFECEALNPDPGDPSCSVGHPPEPRYLGLGDGSACIKLEHQALPFCFNLSPNQDTLVFEPFDDMNGSRELQRVYLAIDESVQAGVTLENLSRTLVIIDLGIRLTGGLTATPPAPGFDLEVGFSEEFYAPEGTVLEPNDGIPGSGPDFFDFGLLAVIRSSVTSSADPGVLGFFDGPDAIPVRVAGVSQLAFGQPPLVRLTVDPLFSNGTVILCYEFTCLGDIDGDAMVGFSDLLEVLSNWGPCAACPQDLDEDGMVGFSDLLEVLSRWGPC